PHPPANSAIFPPHLLLNASLKIVSGWRKAPGKLDNPTFPLQIKVSSASLFRQRSTKHQRSPQLFPSFCVGALVIGASDMVHLRLLAIACIDALAVALRYRAEINQTQLEIEWSRAGRQQTTSDK